MVVLVAGKRKPVALDRVGDEARGRIVTGRMKRLQNRFKVMTAEVRHQLVQPIIVMTVEQFPDSRRVAEVPRQPPPPRRPACMSERRVFDVRTSVDPRSERVAAAGLKG